MTEKQLRTIVNQAMMDKQLGIILWPSWTVWDHHAFEIIKGNEIYNSILSSLRKNDYHIISVKWRGFEMPGIIAVPSRRMDKSEKYFKEIFDLHNRKYINGPITEFPSGNIIQEP